MLMLLRHLLAVAVLPFVVTIVVPLWIGSRNGTRLQFAPSVPLLAAQFAGLFLLATGLALFLSSLRRFAVDGRGTLAPWDPPRHLVVMGPYRYVRHPMISGVNLVLLGESLILLSSPHVSWAAIFFVINALYIPLFEEPQLRDRFGAAYERYRRHVPLLIPRLRPWEAGDDAGSAA